VGLQHVFKHIATTVTYLTAKNLSKII